MLPSAYRPSTVQAQAVTVLGELFVSITSTYADSPFARTPVDVAIWSRVWAGAAALTNEVISTAKAAQIVRAQ
jgi:hypothetical protein